jgi:hypothetical protein
VTVTRLQKSVASLFIVCFITLSVIDATPVVFVGHERLKTAVDPVLDALGLWQGDWKLFAPNPRSINVSISARFVGGDGPPLEWRTPEWRDLSLVQKFFLVRHMKFVELIRLDENSSAWHRFADYPVRQLPPSARRGVVRVELTRHWRETPDPRVEWIPAGTVVRPEQHYRFFMKEVR